MIYCIDSNIIIWGIKKQATPGQEEMIARAEQFFFHADEYEDIILVPTMVLAEILAPEPPQIRAKYLEILSKNFVLVSFNEMASLKYAELLYNRFEDVRNIATSTNVTRQRMKVDHMIIATALVNNAAAIYSTDQGLKSFAQGYIDVRDLPPIKTTLPFQASKQTDLFEKKSDTEPF